MTALLEHDMLHFMLFSFQIPKGLVIPQVTFCNYQSLSVTSMLKLAEIQNSDVTSEETNLDEMVLSYNNLIVSLFTLKDELHLYQQKLRKSNITVSRDNTSRLYEWSTLADDLTKRTTIASLLNNGYSVANPADLGSPIEEILVDCNNAGHPCNTDDYAEGQVMNLCL